MIGVTSISNGEKFIITKIGSSYAWSLETVLSIYIKLKNIHKISFDYMKNTSQSRLKLYFYDMNNKENLMFDTETNGSSISTWYHVEYSVKDVSLIGLLMYIPVNSTESDFEIKNWKGE